MGAVGTVSISKLKTILPDIIKNSCSVENVKSIFGITSSKAQVLSKSVASLDDVGAAIGKTQGKTSWFCNIFKKLQNKLTKRDELLRRLAWIKGDHIKLSPNSSDIVKNIATCTVENVDNCLAQYSTVKTTLKPSKSFISRLFEKYANWLNEAGPSIKYSINGGKTQLHCYTSNKGNIIGGTIRHSDRTLKSMRFDLNEGTTLQEFMNILQKKGGFFV